MLDNSVILIGNPDSGKTNFLARFWLALQSQKFELIAPNPPKNIDYVEEILAHILAGKFAPRTDKEDNLRDFKVELRSSEGTTQGELYIPDASGEMWKKAVESYEIAEKWMDVLKDSSGALLFVRVLSDLNVQPMDWVTCQQQLKAGLGPEKPETELPTQVSLIELTRFLEDHLKWTDGKKPKVAIIISAWDLINAEDAEKGPQHYLQQQFPMFAGRIDDTSQLDVKVYGLSIVGGDLEDTEAFMKPFLAGNIDDTGYVVTSNEQGVIERVTDITHPVSWLLQ